MSATRKRRIGLAITAATLSATATVQADVGVDDGRRSQARDDGNNQKHQTIKNTEQRSSSPFFDLNSIDDKQLKTKVLKVAARMHEVSDSIRWDQTSRKTTTRAVSKSSQRKQGADTEHDRSSEQPHHPSVRRNLREVREDSGEVRHVDPVRTSMDEYNLDEDRDEMPMKSFRHQSSSPFDITNVQGTFSLMSDFSFSEDEISSSKTQDDDDTWRNVNTDRHAESATLSWEMEDDLVAMAKADGNARRSSTITTTIKDEIRSLDDFDQAPDELEKHHQDKFFNDDDFGVHNTRQGRGSRGRSSLTSLFFFLSGAQDEVDDMTVAQRRHLAKAGRMRQPRKRGMGGKGGGMMGGKGGGKKSKKDHTYDHHHDDGKGKGKKDRHSHDAAPPHHHHAPHPYTPTHGADISHPHRHPPKYPPHSHTAPTPTRAPPTPTSPSGNGNDNSFQPHTHAPNGAASPNVPPHTHAPNGDIGDGSLAPHTHSPNGGIAPHVHTPPTPAFPPHTHAPDGAVSPNIPPHTHDDTEPDEPPTRSPTPPPTPEPGEPTMTPTEEPPPTPSPVAPVAGPTESPTPVPTEEDATPAPTFTPGTVEFCFPDQSTVPCPDPQLAAQCDAYNPIGNFEDCLSNCIDAFCCIHDSPSARAPSCSTEINCKFYHPCYIIWWKIHDTIGPAPFLRLQDDRDEFYQDFSEPELEAIFQNRPDFEEQVFGHHFVDDDITLDEATFTDPNNW